MFECQRYNIRTKMLYVLTQTQRCFNVNFQRWFNVDKMTSIQRWYHVDGRRNIILIYINTESTLSVRWVLSKFVKLCRMYMLIEKNTTHGINNISHFKIMFFKIGLLKKLAVFTGKHLCWSLFLKKNIQLEFFFFFETDKRFGVFLFCYLLIAAILIFINNSNLCN